MPPVTCKNHYIITKLAMVPQMRDADLGQSCHSFPSVASLPRGSTMVSFLPQGGGFPVGHGSTSSDVLLFILPLMIALFIFSSLKAF